MGVVSTGSSPSSAQPRGLLGSSLASPFGGGTSPRQSLGAVLQLSSSPWLSPAGWERSQPTDGDISACPQPPEATANTGMAATTTQGRHKRMDEGVVCSAPGPQPCGARTGPALWLPSRSHGPRGSVLLGAGRLGDADVDEERGGRDAGAVLGEEVDVAVACRGDSEAVAEHPAP